MESDGFFLSNGPGDPSLMPQVIEQVKKITNDGRPVFGICLRSSSNCPFRRNIYLQNA